MSLLLVQVYAKVYRDPAAPAPSLPTPWGSTAKFTPEEIAIAERQLEARSAIR